LIHTQDLQCAILQQYQAKTKSVADVAAQCLQSCAY
jgi:hypothetical protein